MVVVHLSVFFLFIPDGGGRDAETRFPIILYGGREFIEMGEEHGDLPHILFAESFVPGGHAGVTDAGAHGVEDVPLGVVGRVGDEIGRWRIERCGESGRFAVEASVTESAVHGVELHAVFQILIRRGQRVGKVGSVAIHRGIDGTHGQAALDARSELEVFERFAELTEGKMALLISHRFSTVRMADRIVVLEGGRLIEEGNHDQLMSRGGVYASMFEMQAASYR